APPSEHLLPPHPSYLAPGLDRVSDEKPARLWRLVPLQPPVAAVDLRGSACAGARAAPRIGAHPLVRAVERHLEGRAADRQVAGDLEAVAFLRVRPLHPLAADGDRRI